MDFKDCKFIEASDVSSRDGIGLEVYHDDVLILEIFRDDTEHSRTITTFVNSIPLEFMEQCLAKFKKVIPWNFIDYNDIS